MKAASNRLKNFARAMRTDMTAAERKAWQSLRRLKPQGFHFRRQVIIAPYIVDFACHKNRLIVEIDGESHVSELAKHKDLKRTQFLKSQGYTVLRFWNNDVFENIDGMVDAIIARATPPTLNPSPPRGREAIDAP
jgi:very-short-patch-repair endonuclease